MTDARTETPHRDNLLGICHRLGGDLGINPLWLRLALGALLLVNLELPFIVYGVLGLVVLATRLIVRDRTAKASAEVVQLAPREAQSSNDDVAYARAA